MHVHSQGKLHIWRLNIVNAGAVDCFYDGPDLREGLMQREARDLKKERTRVNARERARAVVCRTFQQLTVTLMSPSRFWSSWR